MKRCKRKKQIALNKEEGISEYYSWENIYGQ